MQHTCHILIFRLFLYPLLVHANFSSPIDDGYGGKQPAANQKLLEYLLLVDILLHIQGACILWALCAVTFGCTQYRESNKKEEMARLA